MVERLIASVLKTEEAEASVGSNPTLSIRLSALEPVLGLILPLGTAEILAVALMPCYTSLLRAALEKSFASEPNP